MNPEEDFRIDIATGTDTGVERSENQDHVAVVEMEWGTGLIVADGMGGHRGGSEASRVAVEVVGQFLREANIKRAHPTVYQQLLWDAIKLANVEVFERARADEALKGMGTTIVAVLLVGPQAYSAHVGDSRLYHFRDGLPVRLTDDHTIVQELISHDLISQDEGRSHPHAHRLSRAVGARPDVDPEVRPTPFELYPGDSLLLCSDGLTDMVEDEEIAEIIAAYEAEDACVSLIEMARERGAPDNVTMIVATVPGQPPAGLPAFEAVPVSESGTGSESVFEPEDEDEEADSPRPSQPGMPAEAGPSPSAAAPQAPAPPVVSRTRLYVSVLLAVLLSIAATLALSDTFGLLMTDEAVETERKKLAAQFEEKVGATVQRLVDEETDKLQTLNLRLGVVKRNLNRRRAALEERERSFAERGKVAAARDSSLKQRETVLKKELAKLRSAEEVSSCAIRRNPACVAEHFKGEEAERVTKLRGLFAELDKVHESRKKIYVFKRGQRIFEQLDSLLDKSGCAAVVQACGPKRNDLWTRFQQHSVQMAHRLTHKGRCADLDKWLAQAKSYGAGKRSLRKATVWRCEAAEKRRAKKGAEESGEVAAAVSAVEEPAAPPGGEEALPTAEEPGDTSPEEQAALAAEEKRRREEKRRQAEKELQKVKEMQAEEARKKAELEKKDKQE